MSKWMMILLMTMCFFMFSRAGSAQGYVAQDAVAPLLNTQGDLADVQPVSWHIYKIPAKLKTKKAVLEALQQHLDSLPGGLRPYRIQLIELANRVRTQYILQRQEVLVPDSFPADYRAYTPYPMNYTGADSLPKLFVIDKYTQTFGAYEFGKLVRWGLVSTGMEDAATPNGRFTFNWKAAQRYSSAAPPGEVWDMRWVWNFQASRGIHVHQYHLPIGSPVSHGCVRMADADARWNFDWAVKGTPVLVLNHIPYGIAAHWQMGDSKPFSLVSLPPDPMAVPDGNGPKAMAAGG